METFLISAAEWFAGIIGSVIVVYITQLIKDYYFNPKKELSLIIRDLLYTARLYANRINNPGPENVDSDVGLKLKEVAMVLKAYIDEHPRCRYRNLTTDHLESIATRMVFLSNTVTHKKALQVNANQLDFVIKSLKDGKMYQEDESK